MHYLILIMASTGMVIVPTPYKSETECITAGDAYKGVSYAAVFKCVPAPKGENIPLTFGK